MFKLSMLFCALLTTSSAFCIAPAQQTFKDRIGELFISLLSKQADLQKTMLKTYEQSALGKFEMSGYAPWYYGTAFAAATASISLWSYAQTQKAQQLIKALWHKNRKPAKEEVIIIVNEEPSHDQISYDAKKLGIVALIMALIIYLLEKQYAAECQGNCNALQEEIDDLWKQINAVMITNKA